MKNNQNNPNVEIAYNMIKDQIISFGLYPETPVSDSKVAKDLGISRAPVREAIIRLQMEGLITTNERGKLIVSPVSLEDVIDILSVRKALEGEAIRQISKNGWLSKEQEQELQKALNAHEKALNMTTASDVYQADELFHSTIIKYSGSPRIKSIINNMRLQMQRARWLNVANPSREYASFDEHKEIYRNIVKHDLEGWINAVRTHFNNGSDGFARILYDRDMRAVASAIQNFYTSGPRN